MTVHIATKLNHSHLLPEQASYSLPCLGRTEIDDNAQGIIQLVTVEDSMRMVHGLGGINPPASALLKSKIGTVAGMAKATLGSSIIDGDALAANQDRICDLIARVLPEFADCNQRVRQPRGFLLPNLAASREWNTQTRRTNFAANTLPETTEWQRA